MSKSDKGRLPPGFVAEQKRFIDPHDVKTPAPRDQNLDVVGTSQNQENAEPKESEGETASDPLLSVVCPFPAQSVRRRQHYRHYRVGGTKTLSPHQATNIVEAVIFAKSIGLPLVAHLTIHWSGTIAFDDRDGTRFAKVREGLAKVLIRRGIPPAWAWCRECKAHTDIVHSHLLFHLPTEYRSGPKLHEIEAALARLVDRHGDGIFGEFAVKLRLWPDPDGLYLIKGGGPKVWKLFPRLRKEWRTAQGVIHGKRCGVSQNLGQAARHRADNTGGYRPVFIGQLQSTALRTA